MAKAVQEYVRGCHKCQQNKSSNQPPAGLLQPLDLPQYKWQQVTMDLITQLPTTTSGYDAIVVFVDRLTKMTHIEAVHTSIGAERLAEVFFKEVVRLHGVPEAIISDRGTQFSSWFWKRVFELFGTEVRMSTAFHPQTDGQTERMNRLLEDMLRNYVSPKHDDWDSWLPACEFAINDSVNGSTGKTPFFLNYGCHPPKPCMQGQTTGALPAAESFVENFDKALREARTALEAAQQRMKAQADKHRRDVTYAVGDKVLLNSRNICFKVGAKKLMPKWLGPFTVTQLVGRPGHEVAVKLELPAEWRHHPVFHVSLLKPYIGNQRYTPPGPVDWIDGEPMWKVERILDHQVKKVGKRTLYTYLIKWQGYSAEHNSWEPEGHLETCDELVAQYFTGLNKPDELTAYKARVAKREAAAGRLANK